jgi:hypothetical protein
LRSDTWTEPDDKVEKLTDVLTRYPRFREVLLDADFWWEEDGSCQFRIVALEDPELWEGAVAFSEVLGIETERLPAAAPEPAMPSRPPSRFSDRPA